MLSNKLAGASRPIVAASPARVGATSKPTRGLACSAATAWASWDAFITKRGPLKEQDAKEASAAAEIGALIAKSATTLRPRFTTSTSSSSGFKVQHVDKIPVKELAKDLRDQLEVIGVSTLKGALGMDELDYANITHSTTDINAALSITGTVLQKGSSKTAVVVLVATETERQASWSRLEGLIMHWAATSGPGGQWSMPAPGWSAAPNKTNDAGGAVQCQFAKQVLGKNDSGYVLTLQLPLVGPLKSGGVVFVLKATETGNQADRWLKDASTTKDFFLDFSTFPVTNV